MATMCFLSPRSPETIMLEWLCCYRLLLPQVNSVVDNAIMCSISHRRTGVDFLDTEAVRTLQIPNRYTAPCAMISAFVTTNIMVPSPYVPFGILVEALELLWANKPIHACSLELIFREQNWVKHSAGLNLVLAPAQGVRPRTRKHSQTNRKFICAMNPGRADCQCATEQCDESKDLPQKRVELRS